MDGKFTGYEACKIWCAAKAHYNSDYDVLKYQWSFNLSEEAFRLRKDRFTFERVAREYGDEATFKQACGFYLYDNPKGVIRGLIRPNLRVDNALSRYANMISSLPYLIKMDCCEVDVKDKNSILKGVAEDLISPESACVFLELYHDFEIPEPWNKLRVCKLLPKYQAFIGFDKGKVAGIIQSLA